MTSEKDKKKKKDEEAKRRRFSTGTANYGSTATYGYDSGSYVCESYGSCDSSSSDSDSSSC